MANARYHFERLRHEVQEVERMRTRVNEMREACMPRGASTGSIGGGRSGGSVVTKLDLLVDLEAELDARAAALQTKLDRVADVLYGSDGRGGIAKVRGSVDADIIFAYYLDARTWAEVASSLAPAESPCPADWCRMRARRALETIDKVGAETLSNL